MGDGSKRSAPSGAAASVVKRKRAVYHANGQRADGMAIKPGMVGIMVTTALRHEKQASKEMRNLFCDVADRLYGPEPLDGTAPPAATATAAAGAGADGTTPPAAAAHDASTAANDVDDELERELAALREPALDAKGRTRRRFWWHDLDIACVCFCEVQPPVDPARIVTSLCETLAQAPQPMTRYTSRALPIQATCMANLPEMVRIAKLLFQKHFPQDAPCTFSIQAKVRNHTKTTRMEIIEALAAVAPKTATVDLTRPELVVIVEVCKTIAMMSVVRDYHTYKKFNLEVLGQSDAASTAAPAAGATAATTTEPAAPETPPAAPTPAAVSDAAPSGDVVQAPPSPAPAAVSASASPDAAAPTS